MGIENDLFLALYYEHQQRTGHDIFKRRLTYLSCNVCLYLDKIKREYEAAERKYYEEREAAQTAAPSSCARGA